MVTGQSKFDYLIIWNWFKKYFELKIILKLIDYKSCGFDHYSLHIIYNCRSNIFRIQMMSNTSLYNFEKSPDTITTINKEIIIWGINYLQIIYKN